MNERLQANAAVLERELAWLARLIDVRMKHYFKLEDTGTELPASVYAVPPPEFADLDAPFPAFVRRHQLDFNERAAFILALAPSLRPQVLDIFFTRNQTYDRRFTEFGGLVGGPDGAFTPTGETLAFILGGVDVETRLLVEALFDATHRFATQQIFRGSEDPLRPSWDRISRMLAQLPPTSRWRRQPVPEGSVWAQLLVHCQRLPMRSGWETSTPESMTATTVGTPKVRSHARSALMVRMCHWFGQN